MKLNFVNLAFFVVAILVVVIMIPFWKAAVWGITFSIVFYPLHERFERRFHHTTASALLMLLVIAVVIAIPITIAVFITVNETEKFISNITSIKLAFRSLVEKMDQISKLKIFAPYLEKLDNSLFNILQQTGILITKNIGVIFSKTYSIIANLIFSLIVTFYLIRDRDRFIEYLASVVGERERFMNILKSIKTSINATVMGGVLTALIQGIVGAFGFLIVGLNAFFMWMFLIALFSFVPLVGTAIVWVPASIYLFISGNYIGGLFIVGWGVIAIGMIDNYVRPLIIGSKLNVHPMLLFFGILGSIIVFGPIGIILGPVILSVADVVVEAYVEEKNRKDS